MSLSTNLWRQAASPARRTMRLTAGCHCWFGHVSAAAFKGVRDQYRYYSHPTFLQAVAPRVLGTYRYCAVSGWRQSRNVPFFQKTPGTNGSHIASEVCLCCSSRVVDYVINCGGWRFPWLGRSLVGDSKLRQSAKLREIAAALEADGFNGLDAQARALGLSRSTAWTIISGSHKSSGLSARTLNRMLASPLLGKRARATILGYIAEKRAGHYGTSKSGLRKFDQRVKPCPLSPPTLPLNSSAAE